MCVEFGIAVFGSLGNGVVLVTVVVGDRKENRGEEVEGVGDWDKVDVKGRRGIKEGKWMRRKEMHESFEVPRVWNGPTT